MRKHLLILFILLITLCQAFAQGTEVKVTGKVLDSQTKEALIGASILLKGTSKATSVALNGTFKINVPAEGTSTLVISYIGYITQEVVIGDKKDLGVIGLVANTSTMSEVTVTSDVAVDRKTPIAVTTLNSQVIEEKLGTQDLPLLLQVVPGVMASNTQGFGESRVSIRGFSSTSKNGNVAMTINGIPVNDMENGNTYWSDFTGLGDVTTSFQVQRGLGAAKIIVPSFGGTINITTRNTDAVKGGYVFAGIGSDGYSKIGVLVSTGLSDKGWATTFSGSKVEGNYHVDQTNFLAYNYFFNLSKVLSKTQSLSFSIMGSSQEHDTRFNTSLSVMEHAPQGLRYNADAGILNGEPYNPYKNYFSKPVASLNHSWQINGKSSLSTVLYATYGTGAGVGMSSLTGVTHVNGNTNGQYDYSPYDLTAIVKANANSLDGAATNYIKASENDHKWIGLRSTFNTQLTKDINLSTGVDFRDYSGTHYTKVYNLLGAAYVLDASSNKNAPNTHAVTGDKVSFYNIDKVLSAGAYAQAEYTKNDVNAFITLSGTESGQQRNDYFTYLDADPAQHSPWVKYFTYQAKGGANYNINEQMNVFANVGYITKPPYFDNIFESFKNDINKTAVVERLFSYELGYGFKSSGFSANLNFYRSNYMDRSFVKSLPITNGVVYSVNLSGVNEMHEGGELELKYKPTRIVTINGSLSIGHWYYTQDAGPATVTDDQQNVISTYGKVYLNGIKVGDAPQTQTHIGADVDVLPDLRIGGDYFYNGNYTSNFAFQTLQTPGATIWKVPNYNLFNVNASFRFKIAGLNSTLSGNVTNLLNTTYLSDAFDGSATSAPTGMAQNVLGYYGYGRTFSTSLKIKF
ncbi:TonB-dependent receptor [Mucilaginibacter sp. AW1-3]